MALKTNCQTPDMVYSTHIDKNEINIHLNLPFNLNLSKEESVILEKNIHNVLEIVMSKYFLNFMA